MNRFAFGRRTSLGTAAVFWGLLLVPPQAHPAEALNVELVGHSDLQGRASLQVVLKGDYAYIGHHRGEAFNPLTGRREDNGTTIVDVADPRTPRIVTHIPGRKGAESRAVQVAEGLLPGRDFLLRNQEAGSFTGFEVWEITDRARPRPAAAIGPFHAAHKSWWDRATGVAYLSAIQPGWSGQHLVIYDLSDPTRPRFIADWGLPEQLPGATTGRGLSLHHPVVAGNRAYLSYLFGGDMVILNITDRTAPRMVSRLRIPSSPGIHTTAPFAVPAGPGAAGDAPGRTVLALSEEAFASDCREARRQLYFLDATQESTPVRIADFRIPDGDFCLQGGRFGPHQFAETRDGRLIGGTLLYIAYFNAGLRIVELADSHRPREVGYYVPSPPGRNPAPGTTVPQTNDVDLDYRGLIYITDRAGGGIAHPQTFRKEMSAMTGAAIAVRRVRRIGPCGFSPRSRAMQRRGIAVPGRG
ncbi:MAG: LVIVD repeat-containing protein [Syntrophales bacterium]